MSVKDILVQDATHIAANNVDGVLVLLVDLKPGSELDKRLNTIERKLDSILTLLNKDAANVR